VPVHGERDHRLGLRRGEHQLALHLAPGVIRLGGAGPDVDEVGLHPAALAVLRQRQRHRVPARQAAGADPRRLPGGSAVVAAHLPELGEVGVPRPPRALRAVEGLAIGGDRHDLDVGETVAAQLAGDELGGGREAARAAHAVLAGEVLEVALGGLARELLRQRRGAAGRQQRRRLGGERRGEDEESEDERARRPPNARLGHGHHLRERAGCDARWARS
jgi:hypothetical protein